MVSVSDGLRQLVALILHRVKLQLPNHAEFSLSFQHSQIAVQLFQRYLQVFLGVAQIF